MDGLILLSRAGRQTLVRYARLLSESYRAQMRHPRSRHEQTTTFQQGHMMSVLAMSLLADLVETGAASTKRRGAGSIAFAHAEGKRVPEQQ